MSSTKKKASSKASGGKKKPTKAKAKPSKRTGQKVLLACPVSTQYAAKFDAALKRHGFVRGNQPNRSAFIKAMADKLVEKAAPVKKT